MSRFADPSEPLSPDERIAEAKKILAEARIFDQNERVQSRYWLQAQLHLQLAQADQLQQLLRAQQEGRATKLAAQVPLAVEPLGQQLHGPRETH